MRQVTIEGSTTPAAGVVPRGERRTVAYTERIERLIRHGYVVVVDGPTEPEPEFVEQIADESAVETQKPAVAADEPARKPRSRGTST